LTYDDDAAENNDDDENEYNNEQQEEDEYSDGDLHAYVTNIISDTDDHAESTEDEDNRINCEHDTLTRDVENSVTQTHIAIYNSTDHNTSVLNAFYTPSEEKIELMRRYHSTLRTAATQARHLLDSELNTASQNEDEAETEDIDHDSDDNHTYVTKCTDNNVVALLNKPIVSTNIDDELFIIDSGCKGAHVCKDASMLSNANESNAVKVTGITGHSLSSTHVGALPIGGRTFCIPQADANLLSLKLLLKQGGRFSGTYDTLNIYDAKDELILVGKDYGDNYWSCRYADISNYHCKMYVTNTQEIDILTTSVIDIEKRHYSAEERSRAKDAFNLCTRLGHPSDASLIKEMQ
jgi:hypothetical protein